MIPLSPGSDIPHGRARPDAAHAPSSYPSAKPAPFVGFAPLQSNATYCPNQFFDLVLPHFSRGVVRLVGYVLYRTFAWSDRDGRPMRSQHQIAYRELATRRRV